MTRRAHNFTSKQKAQIALQAGGCCQLCEARLKFGEGDADHIIPVQLGGESTVENGQWLCRQCHKDKTGQRDLPDIARAKRREAKHLGVRKPSSWRNKHLKKRMDGTVVDRLTGEVLT